MDQAARGAAALSASNYDEAIKHYTDAIALNRSAVDYYIKRSTAYQRSSKYTEALADAEKAVVLAHGRGRRELIRDSQMRRAIALYFLGQYANAQYVLDIVKSIDDKEKTLAIWNTKIAQKLKDIPEDDERKKVTATSLPSISLDIDATPKHESARTDPASGDVPKNVSSPMATGSTSTAPATPTEKPKHDWYQTNDKVTFTLLAKNVPKDLATVNIEKSSLDISYPITEGKEFNYNLDPLYHEVDAANSTYRITPTKIEITLKKATPGLKWPALEGEPKDEPNASENGQTKIVTNLAKPSLDTAPAYPTSSKKGVKNWDKVAKTVLGDDDDFEGDETSRFFKQLYKGAGEDAQRAMMKSYQESGGTVLSTDWSSVGSKFVAPEPPEGMEAKKY